MAKLLSGSRVIVELDGACTKDREIVDTRREN